MNRTYDTIRVRKVERFVKARRLFTRLTLLALTCGAVAFGWVRLTQAESLAIKRILVEGTGAERADEIRGLLNVKAGDNLLFSDLSLARTRAESHPWVISAAVKREFPDTLRIVVAERTPMMILALDRLYYVDGDGSPFKLLAPGDAYDLPVLTGLDREDLLARAELARDAISGALVLLDSLSEKDSPLGPSDVSEIGWDEDEGYSVVTVSGRLTVRFGRGDYGDKLARLREVRAAAGNTGEWGAGAPPTGSAMKAEGRLSAEWRQADAAEIDLTYSSRVIVAR